MVNTLKKILIIDDEPDITRAIEMTIHFQEPAWNLFLAKNGKEGLESMSVHGPDLVLLDLMLPDMSGFDVLKQIRTFSDIPVILLTVQNDELKKVQGLELGADDYITKPFGNLELTARIRSVIRRTEGLLGQFEQQYIYGDAQIDFAHHKAIVAGVDVSLTSTEFHLLEILAHNAGTIVTSEVLLGRVWGRYALDNPDYLKVYIHRIREKIGDNIEKSRFLHTERGVGYWLELPEKHPIK
jgi:two-component system KDP operon response regulator KdpE